MSSSSSRGIPRRGAALLTVNRLAVSALLTAVLTAGLVVLPSGAADAEGDEPAATEPVKGARGRASSAVQITGNRSVSADNLRKAAAEELNDFLRGGFKDADADDAAYQMELAYRNLGYRFATVDYSITRTAAAAPDLVFVVNEGPRVRVAEIVVEGNEKIPAETLKGFFAAQTAETPGAEGWFVVSAMISAVEEIRTYYYMQGYIQSAVSDPRFSFTEDRTGVTVRVSVEEGPAFVVRDVIFAGNLLPEVAGQLTKIRDSLQGQPYVPRRSAFELESRIMELYGDLGYPDVRVNVERVNDETQGAAPAESTGSADGAVALLVRITSGPRVTIAGIRITGNVKTGETFILSRITLAAGDTYSAAKERSSFRGLYRTGLFSLVRISLAETGVDANRLLLIELEELPSREVSFEVGWGSYELLRGKAEVRNKNFRGKGRILSASAAASLKSTDLGLGFSDPWFLGRDLVFDLPVYYRTRKEPSFDRTETGISTVISKRFAEPRVGISLAYTLRHTRQSSVSIEVDEAGDDYDFGSLKAQASRDTRDDLFFPSRGYRSVVAVEVTDTVLGSSLAFVRFTATNRFFFAIGPRTVLAARYDTGFVVPTTEDLTLPLAERFFNGGASTVRSFRESELGPKDPETGDPIGGSAYNVVSLELRQRFKHNFGGSVFVDFGNIAPSGDGGLDRFASRSDFISATFEDFFAGFRPAVGAGVQYILPVGPLRVDAAFNPSVDDAQREDDFTFHFTVGMAF